MGLEDGKERRQSAAVSTSPSMPGGQGHTVTDPAFAAQESEAWGEFAGESPSWLLEEFKAIQLLGDTGEI